ncbi:MAG: glycosyltransferase [bacterium]
MRIAVLSNHYPLTTHTFIRREIQGLEREGISVARFSIRRSRESLPDIEDQEEQEKTYAVLDRGWAGMLADVVRCAVRRPAVFVATAFQTLRFGLSSHRGAARHLVYLAEACVLRRELHQKEIEHVHVHFGTNAAMVALLLHRLGGPTYSVQIHGPGEFDNPREIHLPEKVSEATFVTAITDFARSQVYRWSDPRDWKKVHVVRCGVDDKFLSSPVQPIPEKARLVCVGRLGRSKGHPVLLEAVERLRDEGLDFEIVLVGDGELRPLIEDLVRSRELEGFVRLVGWMDGQGVREALVDSRGLLLPSFGEGLPVVIMEAFALARPVIATRIAGISELVEDGRNGWVVNAGNVEQLTAAMREALTLPVGQLLEYGRVGREAAREKHDSRVEASKLAKLLASSRSEVGY